MTKRSVKEIVEEAFLANRLPLGENIALEEDHHEPNWSGYIMARVNLELRQQHYIMCRTTSLENTSTVRYFRPILKPGQEEDYVITITWT